MGLRTQKANINKARKIGNRIYVRLWSSSKEGRGVGDANFASSAIRLFSVAAAAELVVSHILRRMSSSLRTMANCFSSRGIGRAAFGLGAKGAKGAKGILGAKGLGVEETLCCMVNEKYAKNRIVLSIVIIFVYERSFGPNVVWGGAFNFCRAKPTLYGNLIPHGKRHILFFLVSLLSYELLPSWMPYVSLLLAF